ncbi:hypothetical protein BC936DRAFT_144859 [Jimgerdemannia flammicorona]|uniref:Putative lipoate-protein ligase A n=1 Tax=Jimgerdemannia flammicorona TaxID=994334 RepID=A0A433DBG6_9FUNG|nr:hypothetical protein BC936DRAFT_144859 [Jimgerdemannia flammicorona]
MQLSRSTTLPMPRFPQQDMGNSNYTIFIPRATFTRRTNVELVTRALLELDIPAYVTERYDIAVDGHKVSGSAYKLTNVRAYHHGTMLIDTKVELLKGALGSGKTGKVRGTERTGAASWTKWSRRASNPYAPKWPTYATTPTQSITSCFARPWQRSSTKSITRGRGSRCVFFRGVDRPFGFVPTSSTYLTSPAILSSSPTSNRQPIVIDDDNVHALPPRVTQVRDELHTWDWIYGQTPEFENEVEREFAWGRVTAHIKARHGHVIEALLTTLAPEQKTLVTAMSVALEGLNVFVSSSK